MLRREVRIKHGHLNAALSHQFGNRAEVNPRHNQPTGKGMPVAMPAVIRNIAFRKRLVKPAAVIVLQVSSGVPEDVCRVLLSQLPLLKCLQCDGVERDVSGLARLRLGQRDHAALERHLSPFQLEMFARPHSGVD